MSDINTEKLKEIVEFSLQGTFDEYTLQYRTADFTELQEDVQPGLSFVGTRKGEQFRLDYTYDDLKLMHENGSLTSKLLADRNQIFNLSINAV